MVTRTKLTLVGAFVALLGLVRPAAAQERPGFYFPESRAYYHRDVGGQVYYYDRAGNPLYYDDYVHYNYPRRFYYRNGGWVLASRGRGYYGHYSGRPYGLNHGASAHDRVRSYSGGHQSAHGGGHGGHFGGHAGRHGHH
jgi:hypothetical protein